MVKFKNRYVLIRVVVDPTLLSSKDIFTTSEIYHSIIAAIGVIHGDHGVGACKQSFSVKVFNEETKILVLRVDRTSSPMILTSIPFVLKIGKVPATLQTLHVGGSMRSCEKMLIRYHKSAIISSLTQAQNQREKQEILQKFRDVSNKLRRDRLNEEKRTF